MAEKKVSELASASTLYESDMFLISQGSGAYASLKTTLVAIAKKFLTGITYASELQTTDKTLSGAINELNTKKAEYVELTGTLVAGQTSITFSDASITTNSTVDPYTDTVNVNPTNQVVTVGAVTLTFDERSTDLGVKVRIS